MPKFEFTVARSAEAGKCPAKIITRQLDGTLEKIPYPYILQWLFEPLVANGWSDFAARLTALTADPAAMLMQGAPLAHGGPQPRLWANPTRPATLKAVPRTSIAIDIDKQPIPSFVGADFTAQARWVRDRLMPEEFAGATMIAMPSASTGLGDPFVFNGRLFFALASPCDLKALKQWARGCRAVTGLQIDDSIYQAGHAIYTARPLCTNFPDPIPPSGRVVLVKGDRDAVDLQIARFDQPLRAAERRLDAVELACGADWEKRLISTVGVAPLHEFFRPLASSIGLACRVGASEERIQEVVAAVLAARADPARVARYGPRWVAAEIRDFHSRNAAADQQIAALRLKLFGAPTV
ncbi:hypothetical protein [Rhodoblastus sp.]|uniref:hypothetical protein n=1 Tax=Rhodoblastus sp. TaxID=1962975 RepID=UPI0026156AD2|nr:hypothetical protein [Rhodoblastus sp.]